MKYLQKTFTIAVSDSHIVEYTQKPKPRPEHEYMPFGAVCFECGFDRIGCATWYGPQEEAK